MREPRPDEEEHEEEEEEDSEDHTEGPAAAPGGTGAKKKKKKKKKKSKAASDAGSEAGSTTSSSSLPAAEQPQPKQAAEQPQPKQQSPKADGGKDADKRLARALDALRAGGDMWLALGGAGLTDAKAQRVADSLAASGSVTSADLSGNAFGEEGIKALVSALSSGGAPELIALDLRGVELSANAQGALAGLRKARKQLTVETGPLPDAGGSGEGSSGGGSGGGGGGAAPAAQGKRRGAVKKLQQQKQQQALEEQRAQRAAAQTQMLLAQQQQQRRAAGNGGAGPSAGGGGGDFRQSPMFRRFFAPGNSDAPDAQPNTDSDEEGGEGPLDVAPSDIWDKVRELLPAGRSSIPSLGEALRAAAGCLESEMEGPTVVEALSSSSGSGSGSRRSSEEGGEGGASTSAGAGAGKSGEPAVAAASAGAGGASTSGEPDAAPASASAGGKPGAEGGDALDGLRPHTRFAAGQLRALMEVLALEPPPVAVQYSREPQPALGTHRLWAADVLAVLLLAGNAGVDAAVAESGALPAVLALALRLDKCSPLHFRALQMVDCCLRSPEPRLWRALFEPGMGAGVTAAAAGCGGGGGDAPCPPLHEALAAIAEQSAGKPMGQRPGRAGLAARVAQVLLAASGAAAPADAEAAGGAASAGGKQEAGGGEPAAAPGEARPPRPPPNEALAQLLAASARWSAAAAPGGALSSLLAEQEGDLCGPRPQRVEPLSEEGGEVGDAIGGGSVISGEQLLAMLQDFSGFTTQE
ncbi:hypothetical protein Rsub_02806 [Raphidocelis subcapitata]|uniref:Uncharacterized protein n=1 Tax=Raphidocelis subcapitata TaxID=307507 RepID=A0A2V0NR02_9CHLO|nr:hypothetical protein Rsub_02806 [Raphidocelis subcapitata]|eukprot:GBF90098.1 hypothetical protein Rsub_02806 [Raphidocelis subcapitata]